MQFVPYSICCLYHHVALLESFFVFDEDSKAFVKRAEWSWPGGFSYSYQEYMI